MMDKATTRKCEEGTENISYARVLVEIKAAQEFKYKIELCYKCKDQVVACSKFVKVEYSWKPPRCSMYKVFGHTECNYELNEILTDKTKDAGNGGKNANKGGSKGTNQNVGVAAKGGNKNPRKGFRPVAKQKNPNANPKARINDKCTNDN
ncbi:hypothetical protein CTI12_AA526170 [Artemisia annua]|uniref:Uncharacterized protein n=1 Tax=Artemisia annua TaxID=35608 RepID=A0A2U1L642_ARTAN|nr:hypothetical protein CTI12_AA526170 [Artemisia annua]